MAGRERDRRTTWIPGWCQRSGLLFFQLSVGDRLFIQIAELYHLSDYAVYEGQVSSESDFFCKTTIQVMEPGEEVLSNLKTRPRS